MKILIFDFNIVEMKIRNLSIKIKYIVIIIVFLIVADPSRAICILTHDNVVDKYTSCHVYRNDVCHSETGRNRQCRFDRIQIDMGINNFDQIVIDISIVILIVILKESIVVISDFIVNTCAKKANDSDSLYIREEKFV